MNDIVLQAGEVVAEISVEAAGPLLAQLATDAPDDLRRAIDAIPTSHASVEDRTVAAQLELLRSMLNEPGPEVAYVPKKPARHLRFRQWEVDAGKVGYRESQLVHGSPALCFAFEAEELDGSVWGITTLDEQVGVAIAQAVLPMITERKPLTWVKDEVKKLGGSGL